MQTLIHDHTHNWFFVSWCIWCNANVFYDLLMFLFHSIHCVSFVFFFFSVLIVESDVLLLPFFPITFYALPLLLFCLIELNMLFSKNGAYPIHRFEIVAMLAHAHAFCLRLQFNKQFTLLCVFMVHAKNLRMNELESDNLNSCNIN